MIENIRVAHPEDGRAIYELVCDMENKTLPYPDFEGIFRATILRIAEISPISQRGCTSLDTPQPTAKAVQE